MLSDRKKANAIRALSMDAVQKANSGHPGMPMGMADIAEVLWNHFLNHNPNNPNWLNRDRFVLSNGHGCMLLYSLLYLSGYDLTLADLKNFRQLHSKTPGHPEKGVTPGVETTTGPLGQGLANAVGLAIAEKHLAAEFNRDNFPLINHFTYAFVGDGCLMEGISHEVCSLAGTLQLGKLIVIYDDNAISIDGEVKNWFTDNTPERFSSYGWHVIPTVDGHDSKAIFQAIQRAQQITDKPTLICCQTQIGFGAPTLSGTASVHGSPLGEDETTATRIHLEWPYPPFIIPEEILAAFDARKKGAECEASWNTLFSQYQSTHPHLAAELLRRLQKKLPLDFAQQAEILLNDLLLKKESVATRKASQYCLTHFAGCLPELLGGSADLTESNLTHWKGATAFTGVYPKGTYLHYGVREFGMSAIMNGIALYGGIIPFGGTFLTFSDYARNAVRLSALMQQKVIFVYTHDSIGLGEDGPTHQPIEHIASLRLIPDLSVIRPCDTVETAIAWQLALERPGPTCLLLSRQNLPFQERTPDMLKNLTKGGYTLFDCQGLPEMIMIATGSEVALAMTAAKQLNQEGRQIRVVSMPSIDLFLAQEVSYQESVLPKAVPLRLAIEAGATESWYRFVGLNGAIIGIDRFGASAKAADVFNEYGFTVDNVMTVTKDMLLRYNTARVS